MRELTISFKASASAACPFLGFAVLDRASPSANQRQAQVKPQGILGPR